MEISAKKVYLGIPIFSARFGFFWKKGIDFFGKKAEKRVYLGIPFFSARYGFFGKKGIVGCIRGISRYGKNENWRVYLGIPIFSARYGKKVSEGGSYNVTRNKS